MIRLFVYGSLLRGESDHSSLENAELVGPVRTQARYCLVDLGVYPALVEGGAVSVVGQLYLIDKGIRFVLDVKKQCPILFQRVQVALEDGGAAEAYVMRAEQVRGKRRLAQGDWQLRFAPRPRPERAGPFVQAVKGRPLQGAVSLTNPHMRKKSV